MDISLEIIGILGGLLFLLGFLQVATNRWNGRSFWYEICNLIGALLLGFYSFQKNAYTNIVLNLIWGTVAMYSIKNIFERHKIRKSKKRS